MVPSCQFFICQCFYMVVSKIDKITFRSVKEKIMVVEAVGAQPIQVPQKKTGGTVKAVASVFVPGLGQFMDGRNKEGAGFLAGTVGLSALGGSMVNYASGKLFDAKTALSRAEFDAKAGAKIPNGSHDTFHQRVTAAQAEAVANSPIVANAKKSLQAVEKSMKKYSIIGGLALIGAGIVSIWNIVDAYKGGNK